MNSNRWVAGTAILGFVLLAVPISATSVLAATAVVAAALYLRSSGFALSRPRVAGRPATPVKLTHAGIDSNELVSLFGGELPDNWQRLMSGVLDVLEATARYDQARTIRPRTARELWIDGPAPKLVRQGVAVFARYGTAQLTADNAKDATRTLTVVLTDGDGARLELSWTVEAQTGVTARTLLTAEVMA